ncbi:MAG: hypothetical protein WD397_12005 [Wenzhouxiangellaceae bacterium]
MNIKIPALGLIFVLGCATANEPFEPARFADPDDTAIDSALLKSLVRISEIVILGDVKAISSIRRVADRVVPGPWILKQYFVEVEDVILSSADSIPDSISFVSYGGDLILEIPGFETGIIEPSLSKSDGYEMIIRKFGGSESLTHSAGIAQTGKYLIFIQTTRQPHLFEGLRLAAAYDVKNVNGADIVNAVSRSRTKTIMIDYDDFVSELHALSEALDTFEPANKSSRRDLHLSGEAKPGGATVPLLKLLSAAAINMFGPVVTEFVVSENPCFIEIGNDACTSIISWTVTGGSRAGETVVSDSAGDVIGSGANGSVAVELSRGSNVFDLFYVNAYGHDRSLASIDAVAAEISGDIFGFDQCEIEPLSVDICRMDIYLLGFAEHVILYDLDNETSLFKFDAKGPFRTKFHLDVPIGGIRIGLFSDDVSEENLMAVKTISTFPLRTAQ